MIQNNLSGCVRISGPVHLLTCHASSSLLFKNLHCFLNALLFILSFDVYNLTVLCS